MLDQKEELNKSIAMNHVTMQAAETSINADSMRSSMQNKTIERAQGNK